MRMRVSAVGPQGEAPRPRGSVRLRPASGGSWWSRLYRCISSALFLSEGTRRDTEVLFCFPKVDHEHLGNMRQRLKQKKQHPEEEVTYNAQAPRSSRPLSFVEAAVGAAAGAGAAEAEVTAATTAAEMAAAAASEAAAAASEAAQAASEAAAEAAAEASEAATAAAEAAEAATAAGVTAAAAATAASEAGVTAVETTAGVAAASVSAAAGGTAAAEAQVTRAAGSAAPVHPLQTPVDPETDDDDSPGWLVLRVSGDDVRHLRPDERSVGSILRHFLYAGECGTENKKSGTHALLLAAQSYRALCPDRLCSSLSQGWMNLPLKKCCKGVSFKRISNLAEVIPCSGSIETFGASKAGAQRTDGGGCSSSSDGVVPPGKNFESKSSLVHMMHLLVPVEDSSHSPETILQALSPSSCSLVNQEGDECPEEATVTRSFVMGDDVGFMQSDTDEFGSLGGVPTSLGPGMLLSSHCVVLLNHYMDLMANAAG